MTQSLFNKATVQSALITTIPAFLVAVVGICFTWSASEKQLKQSETIFRQQMTRDSILNKKQTLLTKRQLELNNQALELVKKQTRQDSINLLYSKNQNEIQNYQKRNNIIANWLDFKILVSSMEEQLDLYFHSDSIVAPKDTLTNTYYDSLIKKQKYYVLTLSTLINKGLNNPIIFKDSKIWYYWASILNNLKGIKSEIDTGDRYKYQGFQRETLYWNDKLLKTINHDCYDLQVLIQSRDEKYLP